MKLKNLGFPPTLAPGRGWKIDEEEKLIEGKIIQYIHTFNRVMRPDFGLGGLKLLFQEKVSPEEIKNRLSTLAEIVDVEVNRYDTVLYVKITWKYNDIIKETIIAESQSVLNLER